MRTLPELHHLAAPSRKSSVVSNRCFSVLLRERHSDRFSVDSVTGGEGGEVSSDLLKLVFTSDGVGVVIRSVDLVKTAFRFRLRLRRLHSAYDLVNTRLSESEAKSERCFH